MNYNTVKRLHGAALLLNFISVLLIILMTVFQKAIRPFILTSSNINDLFTIPVDMLISVIPKLLLFGISFFLIKKKNGTGSKTHVITFFTVMLAFQILIPYINTFVLRVYMAFHSINEFEAYSVLETAINYIVSPLQVISFALFFLSLGGYYGMESKKEQCTKDYSID